MEEKWHSKKKKYQTKMFSRISNMHVNFYVFCDEIPSCMQYRIKCKYDINLCRLNHRGCDIYVSRQRELLENLRKGAKNET